MLSFAEILASHLFHCRDQLSSAYEAVEKRLVRALLEQTERFGRPLHDGWYELNTELRHDELASMIRATRVSVSMAFAELRERGLIEGSRGVYRVNVTGLRALL